MKKKTNRLSFKRQVISTLNAASIRGGLKRATQSDQAHTGCQTNCTAYDCSMSQKQ